MLDRSSSGSSHGSGSGSGSSGYQSQETLSELNRERKLIKETCQVELEDSDQEDPSQVVTVTGGLHLGPGSITNKVTTETMITKHDLNSCPDITVPVASNMLHLHVSMLHDYVWEIDN